MRAVNSAGNSFSLPFKSADWFSTFLVMGLISLIPIVGSFAMEGWMLVLLDNYRQGRTDLPPAGFQHMGRGAHLVVVQLVYGLVLASLIVGPILVLVLAAGGAGAGAASSGLDRSSSGAAVAPLFAFLPLWILGISLLSLARYVFLAPLVLATERGGMASGLNPSHVWSIAAHNWGHTALAGIMVFAASFMGGLGIYACCVGILVSLPYGYAVMAGVIRFYEATFEPSQPAPPAAAVAL